MTKRRTVLMLVLATSLANLLAGCGGLTGTSSSQRGGDAAHSSTAAPGHALAKPKAKPKPKPKSKACVTNTRAKLVLVSVTKQHVWMCAHSRLVYSTAITTGAVDRPYQSTPTGSYVIEGKDTHTTLTLSSGAQYAVKYWIPFDAPLFGFHDSSWQDFPYGSPRYRMEGSHGCVHMPLAGMRFLYRWSSLGTAVTIKA